MQSKTISTLLGALIMGAMCAGSARAQFTFDRSTVFNDATYTASSVTLVPGATPPSIATVGNGGDVGAVFLLGDSRGNVVGTGTVGFMDAQDQSHAVMRQNSAATFVFSEQNAHVSVEGGFFLIGITGGSSRVLLTGGAFAEIDATDSSQVMFAGGSYSAVSLIADANSSLLLNKGGFDSSSQIVTAGMAHAIIRGGQVDAGLVALENSVIDIYGKNLALDSFGHLTGFLADGTAVDTTALSDGTGQFVLHSTPEPSSVALLAFGGLPLVWSAYRKRRKN